MCSANEMVSSYAHVACLACATTLCPTAGQDGSRLSYLGTPLNTTGGPEPTEAPIHIPHVDHDEAAVKLDGRLDEAVWRRTAAYDHMMITGPDKGQPAVYRTHTFMFYTERGLYVGAWNEQPPGTFVGRLSGRDVPDVADNHQIVVDSSGSRLESNRYVITGPTHLEEGAPEPDRAPWASASATW